MGLNENDVNTYLHRFFGQYEDSFQDAWVEILESNAQTINEVLPVAKKVKNRAVRQYLQKQYREKSLQKPIGNDGDGTFTLESILEGPGMNVIADEREDVSHNLYDKIVDFLIGEYLRQRNENLRLRRTQAELRTRRLKLREESLRFRRDRFDAWRSLMEEKGKQREHRIDLHMQLQREKLELRKEQLLLKEKRLMRGGAVSATRS